MSCREKCQILWNVFIGDAFTPFFWKLILSQNEAKSLQMPQTQKFWDWGKKTQNSWHMMCERKGSGDGPGCGSLRATRLHSCAPSLPLHLERSQLLCAPVCRCGTSTACFSRCSASRHRTWKPSFASKAWRKQDSHPVALLESMPTDPLRCVGSLQGISDKIFWIQQKSIFHWNGVLPENFWPVLHWLLWDVGNNSVNTRKSWSIFCVGSWLSS